MEPMSALGSKADMCNATRDVRFGRIADISLCDSHVRFTPKSAQRSWPQLGDFVTQLHGMSYASVSAGQAELSDPRRSGNCDRGIVLSVLDRPAGDTHLRGWRLSPRLKR